VNFWESREGGGDIVFTTVGGRNVVYIIIEFYTSQVVNQISEPSTVAMEFSPPLHGNLPVNM